MKKALFHALGKFKHTRMLIGAMLKVTFSKHQLYVSMIAVYFLLGAQTNADADIAKWFKEIDEKIQLEKYERMEQERQKQKELEGQIDTRRKLFVRLLSQGGKITGPYSHLGQFPIIGCGSIKNYEAYVAFYRYGQGNLPDSSECWPLDRGKSITLISCDNSYLICMFDPGIFGKNFWTGIYLVTVDD